MVAPGPSGEELHLVDFSSHRHALHARALEECDRPAELRKADGAVDVGECFEVGIGMAADLEDRRPAAMTADGLGHHHRIASPSGDDADSLPPEIERVFTGG